MPAEQVCGKERFQSKAHGALQRCVLLGLTGGVLSNGFYFVPASELASDLLTHFWKKLPVPVYGSC